METISRNKISEKIFKGQTDLMANCQSMICFLEVYIDTLTMSNNLLLAGYLEMYFADIQDIRDEAEITGQLTTDQSIELRYLIKQVIELIETDLSHTN